MNSRGISVTHNTVSLRISEVVFMVVTAEEPVDETNLLLYTVIESSQILIFTIVSYN